MFVSWTACVSLFRETTVVLNMLSKRPGCPETHIATLWRHCVLQGFVVLGYSDYLLGVHQLQDDEFGRLEFFPCSYICHVVRTALKRSNLGAFWSFEPRNTSSKFHQTEELPPTEHQYEHTSVCLCPIIVLIYTVSTSCVEIDGDATKSMILLWNSCLPLPALLNHTARWWQRMLMTMLWSRWNCCGIDDNVR